MQKICKNFTQEQKNIHKILQKILQIFLQKFLQIFFANFFCIILCKKCKEVEVAMPLILQLHSRKKNYNPKPATFCPNSKSNCKKFCKSFCKINCKKICKKICKKNCKKLCKKLHNICNFFTTALYANLFAPQTTWRYR